MIVRRLDELRGTGAAATVAHGTVETVRYLLADDGAGFSVSDVRAPAGTEAVLNYKNHVEANLVLEGAGTVEDLATGEVHRLAPGTIYVVYPPDRHIVRHRRPQNRTGFHGASRHEFRDYQRSGYGPRPQTNGDVFDSRRCRQSGNAF